MIPVITAVAGVLSALSSISNLGGASDTSEPSAASAPGVAFSDALKTALNRVDDAIAAANDKAKAFASGSQDVSLSDVMISLEQASLALQTAATVRGGISLSTSVESP